MCMFKNIEEVKKFIKKNEIEFVDFKLVDFRGRFRHLTIPASNLDETTMKYGIGFDASNYGYAKVEKSDMVFYPDLSSAIYDPFSSVNTLTMLANVYEIGEKNVPFNQYPRNVINAAIKYMKDSKIADEALIGPEYEFTLIDTMSYSVKPNNISVQIDSSESELSSDDEYSGSYHSKAKGGYHVDTPCDRNFDLRNDMCSIMKDFGIDVKYHHHEVGGTGQEEIEIQMSELSKAADDTMLVKYIVKNCADMNDMAATFMPKPIYGEAGNGMHVHIILKKNGKDIFYKKGCYSNLSKEALYFIGGLLTHIKSICAFANPTTNSYKRLIPGFEAPVTIGYATSNRSSVIRIPSYAKDNDTRFELRNPDATCNPYYAYAAILLAGIDGIKNKIDPTNKNWGPFDFNLYDLSDKQKASLDHLPRNIYDAIDELKKDNEYLLAGNVFNSEIINKWIETIKAEADEINNIPHPAEFGQIFDL